MEKKQVFELLNKLYGDVQEKREEGEGDLRSVLSLIDEVIKEVDES